jgi:hypothetical protein
MAHSKTPWEYIKSSRVETEYESYKGYTRKYSSPVEFNTHKIVRRGKTNKVLEVILEQTVRANSPLDKKIEDNYKFIVMAVNYKSPLPWIADIHDVKYHERHINGS